MDHRDNLLVTIGSRAAYMDAQGRIELPYGSCGEDALAAFAVKLAERWIKEKPDETNFDEFIETELENHFRKGGGTAFKFRMIIGDWSGDGHEKTEEFIIASNHPVYTVREAHYKIQDKTGINIEELCADFEEDTLDHETIERLRDMGFQFENSTGMGDEVMTPYEMMRIWLFLLQQTEPSLKLEIATDEIPNFQFFGFDPKGRHIGGVGYGLFCE